MLLVVCVGEGGRKGGTEGERERERQREVCVRVCVYVSLQGSVVAVLGAVPRSSSSVRFTQDLGLLKPLSCRRPTYRNLWV